MWQPAAHLAGDDQPEDERDNEQGQKLADETHLRESNTTSDEEARYLGCRRAGDERARRLRERGRRSGDGVRERRAEQWIK